MSSPRFLLDRRLRAGLALLGALSIVGLATPGVAQRFEYVITFDNVVVEGTGTSPDTPELAHREVIGLDAVVAQGHAALSGGLPPKLTVRSPGSLLPFEPGQGTENASFRQEGFLVEAFWAQKTASREGSFKASHFHPADLSTGFEAQHFAGVNDLHGIFIRSLDGKLFGLKSLRYRVTRNRQMPRKPLSIDGFSTFDVQVLIARSFDPRDRIRAQFRAFPVGLPLGNDANLPWMTLRVSGFELVDRLYITSTASVDFDDIVLTRREPLLVPETPEKDK
jgi:hypothetical protein